MDKMEKETSKKYYVKNVYGIHGSTHRSLIAALKESRKREGEGWQAVDSDGHIWSMGWDKKPVMIY
jgi:hypothetical protein